ncbi:PREDICTED: valine--tRNA ligase-like [Rhagoletis zephyria]|uniref:valine--tRNA ligase-like n=1 Tax=Rhagoletis zephyria TaxID=28612 RepID=UPI0008113FB9|nr:PREDICTED: valine--tRNA ligase-like [Rhagoletis zephyria]
MVIEKLLWSKKKQTRHDISREEFASIFNEWKETKIKQIQHQLSSMGTSIDFSKDYFTLSPKMSDYVNTAFIELFNKGLIYRSSYMVNWSYYLQSTLSDIEIEHRFISKPTNYEVPGCSDKFLLGVLHHFKYPIESEDSNEFVTIATTRIESVMGDVALCVHPNDSRYSHLIGKRAFNPFTRQMMPILADASVKPEFGTGVLKLTPAHSLIDYEIAQRHDLPMINIFDDKGNIQCLYEPFNSVHRYAAKELVRAELDRRGLYEGYREHSHWLPVCSRSGDIIESRLVPQWFLRCDDARYQTEFTVNRDSLSEESEQRWNELKTSLDEGSRNVSLIPSSYRNTWKDWFSRHKDWCVSRQIFWGHRIPAFQVLKDSAPTEFWVAAKSESEALRLAAEKYGGSGADESITVKQDSDVLDTWFSSGLLPLAVTGWFDGHTGSPNHRRLPLSLMETGHDIIFFWVARMVMLSLQLSGRLPFDRVLLHGMICDSNGKKMSKSKGNVVDPMHLIEGANLEQLIQQSKDLFDAGLISDEVFTELMKRTLKAWPNGLPVCGADVLRLSLLQSDFKEQKVNFDLSKTVKKRVFSNKMHQTVRFILLHLDDHFEQVSLAPDQLSNIDKWILTKFVQLGNLCRDSFKSYDLHKAACQAPDQLSNIDKWILTKFVQLGNLCRDSFKSYDLHKAACQVEKFWINDLCDVYLESIKHDIIDKRPNYLQSLNLLILVTSLSLRLIHPFMPFITENLYQHLSFAQCKSEKQDYQYRSILQLPYPSPSEHSLLQFFDGSYMDDYEKVFAIQRKIRWFKQNFLINREPLIERIRVASLSSTLPQYEGMISSAIKIADCRLEFVDLHDIYHFDDAYCVQVNLNDEDDEGTAQSSSSSSDSDSAADSRAKTSNSLQADEIYLLFSVKRALLEGRLHDAKLNLKEPKIKSLLGQFDQLHAKNFSENYKRLTKIVS